jgi:hypothetical protein
MYLTNPVANISKVSYKCSTLHSKTPPLPSPKTAATEVYAILHNGDPLNPAVENIILQGYAPAIYGPRSIHSPETWSQFEKDLRKEYALLKQST